MVKKILEKLLADRIESPKFIFELNLFFYVYRLYFLLNKIIESLNIKELDEESIGKKIKYNSIFTFNFIFIYINKNSINNC